MVVTKVAQVNPNKSTSTDLIHSLDSPPHKINSAPAGRNARLGDGYLRFQSARANPAAFTTTLWNVVGNTEIKFRRLMNYWEP